MGVAKPALATAMGFTPDQVIDVPPPIDPYPDGTAQTPIPTGPQQLSGYIRFAFTRRGDLLAAKQRVQAAEALKLLPGVGESLARRLLLPDTPTTQWREMRVPRDPARPACATRK